MNNELIKMIINNTLYFITKEQQEKIMVILNYDGTVGLRVKVNITND